MTDATESTPSGKAPQWWYRTEQSTTEGPIPTSTLTTLFTSSAIDGLTPITTDPTLPHHQWHTLSHYPDLVETLRTVAASEAPVPAPKTAEQRERKRLARKRARKAARIRARENTSVYVVGLPHDATEEEVATHFSKCGIILPNTDTGRPRIKLYRDHDARLKGDAMVTYALRPSVENALSILDGVPLRQDCHALTVREATFDHKQAQQQNGEVAEDTVKRPRVALSGKDLVEHALTWADDHQTQKRTPRVVILKNVFDPLSANYDLINEDMKQGCEACGEVEKLTVFERNQDGAVAVKFRTVEACLNCIQVMNGRWYDGRRLNASFYDGKSAFHHKESEEAKEVREKEWEKWLQGEDDTAVE